MLSLYFGFAGFCGPEFRGGEIGFCLARSQSNYASGHQSRHQPYRSRRED